jgi:hypothetical protein
MHAGAASAESDVIDPSATSRAPSTQVVSPYYRAFNFGNLKLAAD